MPTTIADLSPSSTQTVAAPAPAARGAGGRTAGDGAGRAADLPFHRVFERRLKTRETAGRADQAATGAASAQPVAQEAPKVQGDGAGEPVQASAAETSDAVDGAPVPDASVDTGAAEQASASEEADTPAADNRPPPRDDGGPLRLGAKEAPVDTAAADAAQAQAIALAAQEAVAQGPAKAEASPPEAARPPAAGREEPAREAAPAPRPSTPTRQTLAQPRGATARAAEARLAPEATPGDAAHRDRAVAPAQPSDEPVAATKTESPSAIAQAGRAPVGDAAPQAAPDAVPPAPVDAPRVARKSGSGEQRRDAVRLEVVPDQKAAGATDAEPTPANGAAPVANAAQADSLTAPAARPAPIEPKHGREGSRSEPLADASPPARDAQDAQDAARHATADQPKQAHVDAPEVATLRTDPLTPAQHAPRLAGDAQTPLARQDPSDEQAFQAQALRGLTAAVRQQGGSVTIRLTPPSLGSLRIQLTMDQGVVNASFEATGEQARDLLNSNLAGLRSALESRGLGVDRLHVQLAPAPQAPGGGGQDPGRQEAGANFQRQDHPASHHDAGDGRSRGSFDRRGDGAGGRPGETGRSGPDGREASFAGRLRLRVDAVA